jgi:branched-subunit amino acid aminotransferase/4-amino-4-deoxychorismate lyase
MQPCDHGIPLSDRGFRYGQHFFETVAVRHGCALFSQEHVDRLADVAIKHHFTMDASWRREVSHFLERTPWRDGVLRLFLTAGDGVLGSPVTQPRLFAFWEESLFPSSKEIDQGMNIVSLTKHLGNKYWGIKNGNYWDHICALQEAQKAGGGEGLVFDQEGYLISAAMANVILWLEKNGEILCVTPSISRGARNGVILSWAMEQIKQIDVCDITRTDLLDLRAMALTNSRRGIMPVKSLDGMTLSCFPLSLSLATKYHSLHGF